MARASLFTATVAPQLATTFAGDDTSILERAPGAAPGKRALTDGLAPAAGAPAGAVAEPGALPIGMTFFDGGHWEWLVEADGSFRCKHDPPGAKQKSEGARVRRSDELWDTLYAIAQTQIAALPAAPKKDTPKPTEAPTQPPVVPPIAPAGPAIDQRAEEPTARSWLDELLGVFVPRPVAKLVDVGARIWDRAVHELEDPEDAPLAQRPAAPDPFATHIEPQADKAPEAKAPEVKAPENPVAAEGITGMSQFVWYGWDGRDLKVAEVVDAINVIHEAYGFYPAAKLVTADDDTPPSIRATNAQTGYWWFRADGTPAYDGTKLNRGTQYIVAPCNFGEHVNNVMMYLAKHAPGKRPKFQKSYYQVLIFGDEGGTDWKEVPEAVRNLDLKNLPSVKSCMATARAMMADAHLTPTAKVADGLTDIVSEGGKGAKFHANVDRERARKIKAYLDFEAGRGRPVMTGVTKNDGKGNNDKFTDHWIVINGSPSEGVYTFFDPAEGTSKQARDAESNRLHWDETAGAIIGPHRYVVAWLRTNEESHAEWLAHWAKVSGAATSTPQ